MADIPPIVWIGIGIVVAAVSMLVPALTIFVAAGILFIVIGVAKMARSSKSASTLQNRHAYHTASPRNEQSATPDMRVCFVCAAKNSSLANFCGHCGHRLQ